MSGSGRAGRPRVRLALSLMAVVWSAAGLAQERDLQFARELVELVTLDSTIHLDIRYATPHNFMGRPMYTQPRAFLQRPAADALIRVLHALHTQGYGLIVFDGYRPWSVTKKFWDETEPAKRKYVADPNKGSKHNRGCAVDLTLFDLQTGRGVRMPSSYDDFTEKASSSYTGGTEEERHNRALLRAAMEKEGYRVEPEEWWHFDYREWRRYPLLDIPFEQLPPRVPAVVPALH
jgi:D-alanyl-D-alanine dipeptidase